MMSLVRALSINRAPQSLLRSRYLHCTSILWSESPAESVFEGVSEETSRIIYKHALQPQTSVSLKTLMQSGRGEFLTKTYKEDAVHSDNKVATEKVLMQVGEVLTIMQLANDPFFRI